MKTTPKDFRVENVNNNETHSQSMSFQEAHEYLLTADLSPYYEEWIILVGASIVAHNKTLRAALDEAEKNHDRNDLVLFWVPPNCICIY